MILCFLVLAAKITALPNGKHEKNPRVMATILNTIEDNAP